MYVTFGTVLGHMARAGDVYRTVLRAAAGLEARVLLTVGQAVDPADLGPVPASYVLIVATAGPLLPRFADPVAFSLQRTLANRSAG